MFLLEHNIPLNAADHAGALFRKMFPKSGEASTYACGRTKTAAIIHEMAFSKSDEIVVCLQQGPFAIATDGSNDADSKLYPIVVTYFDKTAIKTCLLSMPALEGDSTGRNIGQLLIDCLMTNKIPIENCIAMSCDNAAVMMGKKNGVAAVLKEKQESIFIVGCPCHLINLAAKKAAACLPVNLDEILVDIYYYLHHSSKRKDKLKEFQNLHDVEIKKILKHVCTRWLSLGRSLTRLVEQWNPLISFFLNEVKKGKLAGQTEKQLVESDKKKKSFIPPVDINTTKKPRLESGIKGKLSLPPIDINIVKKPRLESDMKAKPSTTSSAGSSNPLKRQKSDSDKTVNINREERLFMFLTSDVNKAYSFFLLNVIPIFEQKNIILQSAAPHIHLLHTLLTDLLSDLLIRFVKPTIMKNCNSLLDIDYYSFKNQKSNDDLIIGNETMKVLKSVNEKGKNIFFTSVRNYYIAACDYIVQKFPLKNKVLRKAEVVKLCSIENSSFADIKYFVELFPVFLLVKEDESRDKAMDELQKQFVKLQVEKLPCNITKQDRVDVQWSILASTCGVDKELKFDRIARVMLGILSIPHSNAECERVFSLVRKTRTQFRASMCNKTLEQLLILKSSQSGNCFDQIFDNSFLNKAKKATVAVLKGPGPST